MGGVVVHLDRDALVGTFLHLPARRQIGVEVQHRPVHGVAEAATSIHRGFFLQVAGGQRHLVRCSADGGAEIKLVGVAGEVVVGAGGLIFLPRESGRVWGRERV